MIDNAIRDGFNSFFAQNRLGIPDGVSIHPNTASLNYRTTLAEGDDGLRLGLFYKYGSNEKFGLPRGWSLDIPYMVDYTGAFEGAVMDRSLIINARTYPVDFNWTDANEHASGLRYINDPKVKLHKMEDWGHHAFTLDLPDGSSVSFSGSGLPIEENKADGSYIRYTFSAERWNHENSRLSSIEHSSGQKINLTTGGSQMTVTSPDGGNTEVNFSDVGVTSIKSPDNLVTNFGYDFGHISKISHPNGCKSYFNSTVLGYTHSGLKVKTTEEKKDDHTILDNNGHIQQRVTYELGNLSDGKTFMGGNIQEMDNGDTVPWVPHWKDTTMEWKDDYLYDVTQSTYNNKDNATARTTTWFNFLHLPVEEIHYNPNGNGDWVKDWKIVYSYNIPADQAAKTSGYGHPVSIEKFKFDGSGNWTSEDALTEDEYNECLEKATSYVW